MFQRTLGPTLQRRHDRRHGSILVVTGARQVGKSTLVRGLFPDHAYINLDDPIAAETWSRRPATEWITRTPRAIVDEVQKLPSLLHTLKAAHDASPDTRYVLTGSSQITLLSRTSETLAGRAALFDLWPLTLPELAAIDRPPRDSRLVAWLRGDADALDGVPATDLDYPAQEALFAAYLDRGAMPAVHAADFDAEDVRDWLVDYRRTYLQRDVADLAALRDLEPFTRAQAAIAERSGRLVNFADLSRAAGVSPGTAQRFLRYLELSYQVIVLPPWHKNTEKRLSKAPKVHFVDPGVLQATTRRWGAPTGEAFESAVVAEVVKQIRTARLDIDAFHLRTWEDREVDLLLSTERGYVAIEVKLADRVAAADARHLRDLAAILDRPLIGAFVLHRGVGNHTLGAGVQAVPAAWALSPA